MKNKKFMKVIIIIAVIIIPVLYSFFYLKAFWDPYGNLHDMNIAIVNLDEGDNDENLGTELVNKLKDKDTMTITVLNNSDEAQEGLVNQDYYATITIPKNFTKDLNNAENSDRKVTTISYSPNQKNNYLASQIINKVVTTVETELRSEVSKKVVGKLSDKLEEVPNKMEEISDGASQLQDGTSQLQSGLQELNKGTNNLSTNYEKFDSGVDSAYAGSNKLANGLNSLKSGADEIYSGTSQLAEKTNTLNAGVSSYVKGVNQLVSSVNATSTQIQKVGEDLVKYQSGDQRALTEAIQILQTMQSSSAGSAQLLGTLQSKGTELEQGVNLLNTKVQTLNSGMFTLKQGISSAKTGNEELQKGLKELSTNSKTIKEGTKQLSNGSSQALNGSQTLLDGTNTFKNEINNGIENTQEELKNLNGLDEYTSEPVEVDEQDYAQVDSYGVGFAPYFMSISLWVGALIMLIIFYYDPEDRFKLLGRNAQNKYLRAGLYFAISVTQGIVLGFILKAGLGFGVTNIWLYYGTCILTSIVFFSILQFLVIKLGDVGKFLGILLLVLQLAASGGTFPIETVPKFFQSIYKFMPMNYTIRLIKESLIKVDNGMIAKNACILVGIFIVFMAITLIADYLKTKHDKKANVTSKN